MFVCASFREVQHENHAHLTHPLAAREQRGSGRVAQLAELRFTGPSNVGKVWLVAGSSPASTNGSPAFPVETLGRVARASQTSSFPWMRRAGRTNVFPRRGVSLESLSAGGAGGAVGRRRAFHTPSAGALVALPGAGSRRRMRGPAIETSLGSRNRAAQVSVPCVGSPTGALAV